MSKHIFCDHEIFTCESRTGKKRSSKSQPGGGGRKGSIDPPIIRRKGKKKQKKGHQNLSRGGGEEATTRSLDQLNPRCIDHSITRKKSKKRLSQYFRPPRKSDH